MRLITIPLSHYCERARWALERARLPYREERHLQMVHVLAVRRAGGGRTVPVLVADGEVMLDSAQIVSFADRRAGGDLLYPRDAGAAELLRQRESVLAGEFGVATRLWVYEQLMDQRDLLLRYNNTGAPSWQRALLTTFYPLAKRAARRRLGSSADALSRAEEVISTTLDRIAGEISGRRFLGGDRFSALDLTFASMCAPLLLPEEYGVPMPPLSELPEAMRPAVERFRAHPAGAFALRLFREERRV